MASIAHELARAKLTRRLRVSGRRDDGFHTLDAEMVTLDFADELSLSEGDRLEVVDAVDWVGERPESADLGDLSGAHNLVVRALRATGSTAAVRLLKRIPPGSGLGGGSADAAAVLRWAGVEDLAVAAALGADVPFCVRGGRATVKGVGEQITELGPIDLSFVLLSPPLVVSTAAVYAAFDEMRTARETDGGNDLEEAALVVEPRLKRYRDVLADASGQTPRLAGSGGTWFVECPADRVDSVAGETKAAVMSESMCAVVTGARTD